jgi:hypothetical protein
MTEQDPRPRPGARLPLAAGCRRPGPQRGPGLVLLRHRADLTISLLRGHGRRQAGPHGTFARRQRAAWWDCYEPASVTSQVPVWRSANARSASATASGNTSSAVCPATGFCQLARASTRWTAITCAAWSRAVISPRMAARVSSLPSVYWMSRPARLGVVNTSRWKVRTSGWSLRPVTEFPHGSRGKGLSPRSLEVFDDLGVAGRLLRFGVTHLSHRKYRGPEEMTY